MKVLTSSGRHWVFKFVVAVTCTFAAFVPPYGSAQVYDPSNRARGIQAFDSKDYVLAMHLLRPFALQGDPAAEFMVGNILAQGLGTPRNENLGLEYIMKSAAQGYPRAQAAMGVRYVLGQGVPRDNCKAFDMFSKAYAQDPKLDANEMGNMYKDGLCVPRSLEMAQRYYNGSVQPETPHNQDNMKHEPSPQVKAQIDRAAALEENKQYPDAIRILQPLATGGERLAQDHLGFCYLLMGRSASSAAQAAYWWQQAAAQHSGYAESMLGELYEQGLGVRKDEAEAFRLYESSASKMTGTGYFHLGRAYEFGIGTPPDRDKAIQNYAKAGQQGDDRGAHYAEFLKDPNNVDFRTDAEYQAYLKKKAADEERARRNVTCSMHVVSLYRDANTGQVSSGLHHDDAEYAGPSLRRFCGPGI